MEMETEIEVELEDSMAGTMRLFPEERIRIEIVIGAGPGSDLNTWQDMVSVMNIPVGSQRVYTAYYAKDPEMYRYRRPYRKKVKEWFRLVLERKISMNTFELAVMEIVKKFISREDTMKRRIEQNDSIAPEHKEIITILLENGTDTLLEKILKGIWKYERRTKILESVPQKKKKPKEAKK